MPLGISLDAFLRCRRRAPVPHRPRDGVRARQARQKNRADQVLAEEEASGRLDDVSVFPLAIPMIVGPGSIATAMLHTQNAGSDPVGIGIVSFAIGANLVLACLIFLVAGPLLKVMGDQIARRDPRIFGVILSALAVQMIITSASSALSDSPAHG